MDAAATALCDIYDKVDALLYGMNRGRTISAEGAEELLVFLPQDESSPFVNGLLAHVHEFYLGHARTSESSGQWKVAIPFLKQHANANNAQCAHLLGVVYYLGHEDAPKDLSKARHFFQRAADSRLPAACLNLGYLYYSGKGVPKDCTTASSYFQLSADQGNATAQHNLGNLYFAGEGVEQDYSKAKTYFELAAKQGHSNALNSLGNIYYQGNGVEQDYTKARHYYELASNQSHAEAQNKLGNLYYKGEGVPQDHSRAMHYYKLSADQGNAEAQNSLGNLYYTKAKYYFELAASNRCAAAEAILTGMCPPNQAARKRTSHFDLEDTKPAATGGSPAKKLKASDSESATNRKFEAIKILYPRSAPTTIKQSKAGLKWTENATKEPMSDRRISDKSNVLLLCLHAASTRDANVGAQIVTHFLHHRNMQPVLDKIGTLQFLSPRDKCLHSFGNGLGTLFRALRKPGGQTKAARNATDVLLTAVAASPIETDHVSMSSELALPKNKEQYIKFESKREVTGAIIRGETQYHFPV